jgi:hypothetical protein
MNSGLAFSDEPHPGWAYIRLLRGTLHLHIGINDEPAKVHSEIGSAMIEATDFQDPARKR